MPFKKDGTINKSPCGNWGEWVMLVPFSRVFESVKPVSESRTHRKRMANAKHHLVVMLVTCYPKCLVGLAFLLC